MHLCPEVLSPMLNWIKNGKLFILCKKNRFCHLDLLIDKFLYRDIFSLCHNTVHFIDAFIKRQQQNLQLTEKDKKKQRKIRDTHDVSFIGNMNTDTLREYSIQLSTQVDKLCSLQWLFFLTSINIYLCAWSSPQRCLNICSIFVTTSWYLQSTLPQP